MESRKPATVLFCPPQIPHDLTWVGTLAAAVEIRKPATVPFCPPQIPHILTWVATLASAVESD
jgi:hypothetical protein